VNPHQIYSQQPGQLSAASRTPNGQQVHPELKSNVGSFDSWWQGVFAHHAVMAAQADALMRAHQRVSASSESRVNQAH
jgi:hypothetical protein